MARYGETKRRIEELKALGLRPTEIIAQTGFNETYVYRYYGKVHRAFTLDERRQIATAYRAGVSKPEIARRFNVSPRRIEPLTAGLPRDLKDQPYALPTRDDQGRGRGHGGR